MKFLSKSQIFWRSSKGFCTTSIDTIQPTSELLKFDEELNLPYKLYGIVERPQKKTSFIMDQIFSQFKLPKDFVTEYLNKIYLGTLYSMENFDKEFLTEYLEPNFAARLIQSLQNLKSRGYKLKVIEDFNGNYGEPIPNIADAIDSVIITGLNVDRSKNLSEDCYHIKRDIDDMGIILYTPLSLTDPENFIDPEKNKTMYDNYKKGVARILVSIINRNRLAVYRPDGSEVTFKGVTRNWEHLALFETDLKAPEKFKSIVKHENHMEWLRKFKIGKWYISDLDNWMHGNPLIYDKNSRKLYEDPIFQNTPYDAESKVDIRKTQKKKKGRIQFMLL